MHHWSGSIDDATDEWLPQWRHDPAWTTSFAVAILVRLDQWWVFEHLLLQYFLHSVINKIQIWRIWRPQLRWNKLFEFLSLTTLCDEHFKFHKLVCRHNSGEVGNVCMILHQIHSGNYVLNFNRVARVLSEILQKMFGLFFPDTLYNVTFSSGAKRTSASSMSVAAATRN